MASILEWRKQETSPSLAKTFLAIADFFEAKNSARPSAAAQKMAARYHTVAQDILQGKESRLQAAKRITSLCENTLPLTGSPALDWGFARRVLEESSELAEIAKSARMIRLFGATDDIGSSLVSAWDRRGDYGTAVELVRRALNASKLQSEHREPRGCTLMTIHKAKGKEFHGVLIVEGINQFSGAFHRDADSEADKASTRRLLRVAITRARRRVVILQPYGLPALS